MRHLMICISGFSGAGKDECALQLVQNHRAVQTGLADPAKRHMADVYGFTEQQLFGPSKVRNAGDLRWMKNNGVELGLKKHTGTLPETVYLPIGSDGSGGRLTGKLDPELHYWTYESRDPGVRTYAPSTLGNGTIFVEEGDPEFWLSPREVLQQYCEKLNNFVLDTWIHKGVKDQLHVASGLYRYERMRGLIKESEGRWNHDLETTVTCFADFRHIHEVKFVRNFANFAKPTAAPFTPILVRVKRPSIKIPPYNHRSETEQIKIRDAAFDVVIDNDKTVADLHRAIDKVVYDKIAGNLPDKPWSDSYVLPDRRPEEGYAP